MARFQVEIRATGWVTFAVDAADEDNAVAKAWEEFKQASPVPGWDVHEVTNMDEEEDDG